MENQFINGKPEEATAPVVAAPAEVPVEAAAPVAEVKPEEAPAPVETGESVDEAKLDFEALYHETRLANETLKAKLKDLEAFAARAAAMGFKGAPVHTGA